MEQQQIKLEIPYQEPISRLFILRWLWYIPLWFIMTVWSIWVSFIGFAHIIYQLIYGRRHKWMWDQMRVFFIYMTRWYAYFALLVDKKPELVETEL